MNVKKLQMAPRSLPARQEPWGCEFAGVSEVPGGYDKPALAWDFLCVEDGEHKGFRARRITSFSINPDTEGGKMLMALSDADVAVGAEVNLDDYIGNDYLVTVEAVNGNGGTRVVKIETACEPGWRLARPAKDSE